MQWLDNFIANLIGKRLAVKLKLEDKQMIDKKHWWRSKTIWAGVFVILRAAYIAAQGVFSQLGFVLPDIPPWIDALATGLLGEEVIRGRVTATKQIELKSQKVPPQ